MERRQSSEELSVPTVGDWLAVLDEFFPPAWAEEWDNTGLQVGDRSWEAPRVLVALDPTPDVVAEAVERGCGLLITHHPLLFHPISRLDLAEPVARAAGAALGGGVAVAACHTNADVAKPGVSDALAEELGVEVTGLLSESQSSGGVKLVTFVPHEATAKVLDAVAGAGAGVIGEYTHCSFRVRGTGTFLPSERAHPTRGERHQLNEVEEDRLEVLVPRERLAEAVEALVDAHPYEEVAYEAYPLLEGGGWGLGRIGRLPEPVSAKELALLCRERLSPVTRLAGDPAREIRTVALCGGSGAALIPDALRAGVDAYISGDLKHHQALDIAGTPLVLIDAGHHGTEWPFVPHLSKRLTETGLGEVVMSEIRTDPFILP